MELELELQACVYACACASHGREGDTLETTRQGCEIR